jgi:pimeloyl-ACP methyl ester carboxylesterase
MSTSIEQGNRLTYEDRGTGVPIVFIHGLTFSKETWRPVIDRLADRYRCVAIDLPGHGESRELPRSMEEVMQQVYRLVTDLGIERPVIVGHSYGALFVTFYAAQMPVAGVVNVDQSLLVEPLMRMSQQMEPVLRGPHFATAFQPIRQGIGIEMLPEPLRSSTQSTQSVRQDLVVAYWYDVGRPSPQEMQAMVDDATSRITAPYLTIFGHQLPREDRDYLREQLPALEFEEWPDRGHMVHLMEPGRFADRISAFIESLRHNTARDERTGASKGKHERDRTK